VRLPGVEFLRLLDVAVGANDFLVGAEEKENAGDVGAADAQLHDCQRAVDWCSERSPMVVPVLEFADAGNDQLVQGVVLAFEGPQELGNRFLSRLGPVEDDPVFHDRRSTTDML
jgi:hypothetical protein